VIFLLGIFGKIGVFRVSIDMRVVYESVWVEVNLYTWTFFLVVSALHILVN